MGMFVQCATLAGAYDSCGLQRCLVGPGDGCFVAHESSTWLVGKV